MQLSCGRVIAGVGVEDQRDVERKGGEGAEGGASTDGETSVSPDDLLVVAAIDAAADDSAACLVCADRLSRHGAGPCHSMGEPHR